MEFQHKLSEHERWTDSWKFKVEATHEKIQRWGLEFLSRTRNPAPLGLESHSVGLNSRHAGLESTYGTLIDSAICPADDSIIDKRNPIQFICRMISFVQLPPTILDTYLYFHFLVTLLHDRDSVLFLLL